MVVSPYKATQWIDMPTEERDTAVKKYLGLSAEERKEAIDRGEFELKQKLLMTQQTAAPSVSSWIGMLRGSAYIVLFAGILASLFFGISLMKSGPVLIGLAVLIIGVIISLLSVAGLMVFLDMASDISAIRQRIERDSKR